VTSILTTDIADFSRYRLPDGIRAALTAAVTGARCACRSISSPSHARTRSASSAPSMTSEVPWPGRSGARQEDGAVSKSAT
jgi:hypothetical protein